MSDRFDAGGMSVAVFPGRGVSPPGLRHSDRRYGRLSSCLTIRVIAQGYAPVIPGQDSRRRKSTKRIDPE
ncbi:hypothetical protein COO20_20620 [Thalassospira marina]|uniref:Uncharacterized protein n=1 Tax=Thalassospira marina TaxID=2048283 RepID=A0A2N3KJ28_9PROT|nr:hypothetical protein COO20_20620 [Thalassospira marina]